MTTPTRAGACSPPPNPAGRWPLLCEGIVLGSHPQRGKTAARGLVALGQRTLGPLTEGGTRERGGAGLLGTGTYHTSGEGTPR